MKEIDYHMEDLLFKYQEGLLSETERRQVENYVAAHPEAQELMELYDTELRLPRNLPPANSDGDAPLIYPDKEALKHKEAVPFVSRRDHAAQRRIYYYAAACATALLVVGITFITRFDNPVSSGSPTIAMAHDNNDENLVVAENSGETTTLPTLSRHRQTLKAADRRHHVGPMEQATAGENATAQQKSDNHSDQIAYVDPAVSEQPANTKRNVKMVDNLIVYNDNEPANNSNPDIATVAYAATENSQSTKSRRNFLHQMSTLAGVSRKKELSQDLNVAGNTLASISDGITSTLKVVQEGPQALGERAYAYAVSNRKEGKRTPRQPF